ncbi:hypothetical protein PCASD_04677 [Puccinia coronata f. sp. avenae]|uniref:ABC transmembrane type-1 domain-containing protein n=1 Tax=Puccinia coronata f. sp. avenae TaxID=200324 RepID=A0A2N5UYW4_9BASI|nr:hypothetical protein PCASD_19383 [Puccinia coronata f. sp. avenae]PLW42955.1 hypothetical protein PCASD_04677 [Puccinia coronata f. sp. avenae]
MFFRSHLLFSGLLLICVAAAPCLLAYTSISLTKGLLLICVAAAPCLLAYTSISLTKGLLLICVAAAPCLLAYTSISLTKAEKLTLISGQVATAKFRPRLTKFLLARKVASYLLAEEGLLKDIFLSAKEGYFTGSYLSANEDIGRQVATAEVLIAR